MDCMFTGLMYVFTLSMDCMFTLSMDCMFTACLLCHTCSDRANMQPALYCKTSYKIKLISGLEDSGGLPLLYNILELPDYGHLIPPR